MEIDDIAIFINNNSFFNFRVAAFIECEDEILLFNVVNDGFWSFVGGRVKINESTEQAIKRELFEELNFVFTNFKERRLCENFFIADVQDVKNAKIAELLMIYNLEIPKNHPLYLKKEFYAKHGSHSFIYKWFKKDEIKNLICMPKIIYEMVKEKDWTFSKTLIKQY